MPLRILLEIRMMDGEVMVLASFLFKSPNVK